MDSTEVNTFVLSKENLSDTIRRLGERLAELELSKNDIMMAKLLTEEVFVRVEYFTADTENFSARVSIKKMFGDIKLVFAAKGASFNPLKNLSEVTDDDVCYWNVQVLKLNLDRLKYSRTRGENIIFIKIHESANKFVRETAAGLIFGTLVGIFLKEFTSPEISLWISQNIIDSLQEIFINALMMVVAPMIFFTIIDGIINMSDASYIERVGRRLMIVSLLKLAFYVALGLFVGRLFGGMPELLPIFKNEVVSSAESTMTIRDLFVSIVPSDALSPFSENNILQLLFLACFLGVMLNRAGEYAAWAREGVKFLSRFTVDVIGVLSLVIPYLVAVSMAELMLNTGISGLIAYIGLIVTSALGLPICFLISAAMIALVGKISPAPFLKKATRFSILPFSLSSSNACLPATLEFCSKELGMDEKLSKFTIPVGMQFNMDGTAFYVAVISMMLARTFDLSMDANFLISFFLVEFFMALTGIGLLVMPPVLGAMGIPETAVAHFIGIEPILDMFGTAQSVIGNITSSFLVTRSEKLVDEKTYNRVR